MNENKVIALEKPGEDERDALTAVLRQGAWRMLAQTVEAEVEAMARISNQWMPNQGPPVATLPRNCSIDGLVTAISKAGGLGEDWESLEVQFPEHSFMECSAMSFLCTWGMQQGEAGRNIRFSGDGNTIHYLARMDLQEHLEITYDPGHRNVETGRFIPLRLIRDSDDVIQTVNGICDLILHQFDNARQFIPALEWAINEIIDNIIIHAQANAGAAVCAQYYPKIHRLNVGICDLHTATFLASSVKFAILRAATATTFC